MSMPPRPTHDTGRTRTMVQQALGSVWLRALVTVVLLGVVALNVDWSRMEDRVAHGRPAFFLAAVALIVTTLGVGVVRWQLLLRAAGITVSAIDAVRVYAISTFSSTFLPTSMGGDVARALLVVRRGPRLTPVGVSIAVDRFGGLVGLLGVAWLALAVDSGAAPSDVIAFLGWVTLAFVVGTAAATWLLLHSQAVRRLVPARLRDLAARSRGVLRTYAADRRLLLEVTGLSLVFQALVSLSIVALARSIDVDVDYPTAALTLTLMTLATMVPLSIGGFGVREASYVVILGPAGVSTTDATLISLLTVVTLFVASLPGAVLLAQRGTAPILEAA